MSGTKGYRLCRQRRQCRCIDDDHVPSTVGTHESWHAQYWIRLKGQRVNIGGHQYGGRWHQPVPCHECLACRLCRLQQSNRNHAPVAHSSHAPKSMLIIGAIKASWGLRWRLVDHIFGRWAGKTSFEAVGIITDVHDRVSANISDNSVSDILRLSSM